MPLWATLVYRDREPAEEDPGPKGEVILDPEPLARIGQAIAAAAPELEGREVLHPGVVSSPSLLKSDVSNLPVNLLVILGLAAAGLLILARSVQGVRSRSTVRDGSTSRGVAERATKAGAEAAEAFAEGRAATKAAETAGGDGEGALAETAPDPGVQPTDSVSDPFLVGWVPGKRIRLLIADDHPIVRVGLQDVLARQPDFEVVGEASTGAEAVELAGRLRPQVVLMDLRMPEMDGVTAIGRIKADYPEVQVLVLTTYDSDADILPAIERGATDYLLKDAPREALYQAIRAAAQGESPPLAGRPMERTQDPTEEAESLEGSRSKDDA